MFYQLKKPYLIIHSKNSHKYCSNTLIARITFTPYDITKTQQVALIYMNHINQINSFYKSYKVYKASYILT